MDNYDNFETGKPEGYSNNVFWDILAVILLGLILWRVW
jgi:hypothetical protein